MLDFAFFLLPGEQCLLVLFNLAEEPQAIVLINPSFFLFFLLNPLFSHFDREAIARFDLSHQLTISFRFNFLFSNFLLLSSLDVALYLSFLGLKVSQLLLTDDASVCNLLSDDHGATCVGFQPKLLTVCLPLEIFKPFNFSANV